MSTISASTTSTTGFKVTSDTTGTLVLQTGASPTTAVTIDGSQNVGIGTTSPSRILTIEKSGAAFPSASNPSIRLNETSSGRLAILELDSSQNLNIWNSDAGSGSIKFYRGSGSGTLSMTLDGSGNLGLRVTPSAWHSTTPAFQIGAFGLLTASTSSNYCNVGTNYYFNGSNNVYIGTGRSTLYSQNDGAHSWLTSASGTAGGTISFTTAMSIDTSGNLSFGSWGLLVQDATQLSIGSGDVGLMCISNSGQKRVIPRKPNSIGSASDNLIDLGDAGSRYRVIYAGTGTINTSDRNEKQDIQDLTDAEKRAATKIKALFKTFRFRDAVAQKGDEARIHCGVVAQDVRDAFASEGLDAHRYALFCSDTWYTVNGRDLKEDGASYTADDEGAVENTRLGIRYSELLAFVIAAM